jgi:hypothetical protein
VVVVVVVVLSPFKLYMYIKCGIYLDGKVQ